MTVELENRQLLEKLLKEMESVPLDFTSAVVMACLRLKLSDLTTEYLHVEVDSWPNWSCVFATYKHPFNTAAQKQVVFRGVMTYTKSVDYLIRTFLDETRSRHEGWNGGYFLDSSVAKKVCDSLPEGKKLILPPGNGFYIDLQSLPEDVVEKYKRLPDGFAFGTLGPTDVATVYDHWYVEEKPPFEIVRYNVCHLPNVCVRDSNGLCVAWALTMSFGLLSHLFILPDFRGKGMARAMLMELATRWVRYGLNNIGIVFNDNVPSLNLCRNTSGVKELDGKGIIVIYLSE